MSQKSFSKQFAQKGVSLIEVLVAVLVMAVGLLGLASLQAVGMHNNTSAYHRTQAIYLSYDIMDRMRANYQADYAVNLNSQPANATNCAAVNANCSPQSMAQYDLSQWKCSLGKFAKNAACTSLGIAGVLPEGNGQISESNGIYTISIQWIDDQSGNVTSLQMSTTL